MSSRPFLRLVSLLLGMAGAWPVVAQEVPAAIRTSGKLVVATNPNYAPITYKDPATGRLTGFDIELTEEIAKRLSLRLEWQEIALPQMLPSLATGRVVMLIAGINDIPARRESAHFVNYLQSGAQFYTVTGLAAAIRTTDDLCGKSVGGSRAANWGRLVAAWSDTHCVGKGKPPVNFVGTEDTAAARIALKTMRVQAAVQGSDTLPHFQKLEPNTFVPLGEPFTRQLLGIGFAKTPEGEQLRDAVKAVLDAMQADGSYDALVAKHGLAGNAYRPITINQGS